MRLLCARHPACIDALCAGHSALNMAAEAGHVSVLEALLEHGALLRW